MGKIVVPGEIVAEDGRPGFGVHVDGGKTYSSVIGLLDDKEGRVIALQGPYIPRIEDWVIGVVEVTKYAGYDVEIKSPYKGFISTKMTRTEFKLGDVVGAEVGNIDEARNIDLMDPRRLSGGEILEISAMKVPRVIGKKNSMINTVIELTKSEIMVGRNGRIWIRGGNSAAAAAAILMIEREAHTSGLTDRVTEFLKKEVSKQV
jgi:exosome complex component RRP4